MKYDMTGINPRGSLIAALRSETYAAEEISMRLPR